MNWEKKLRELTYEEALDKLISFCNTHELTLYRHTDNYILGSSICVLSVNLLDIGFPFVTLAGEKKNNDKRWYLSIAQYEKFLKL